MYNDLKAILEKNLRIERGLIRNRIEETEHNIKNQEKLLKNFKLRLDNLNQRMETTTICERQFNKAIEEAEGNSEVAE